MGGIAALRSDAGDWRSEELAARVFIDGAAESK
jgi:hypothetical protein